MEYKIPDGWKLAWMSGKSDGSYLAEYIPSEEDINTWRGGYFAIERLDRLSQERLDEIAKFKMGVPLIALIQHIEAAKKSCGGKHFEMFRRTNTFNAIPFAVGGGYCDKYGVAAPFGEGSFVAYAEGKQYYYKIQYGWRPKNAEEQARYQPWRISPEKAKEYLESIKAIKLCGGDVQPKCEIVY